MNDRPDDPESGAGEPKPPKIKAEDNPWYLLATLYGVTTPPSEVELREKNRAAWNRYRAANLNEKTRTKLIENNGYPAGELRPFSREELQNVATTFARRCEASGKNLALPESGTVVDFSNVEFEQYAYFDGYLLGSYHSSFEGAIFSSGAGFSGAAFSGWASFVGATFSGGASFDGATFSGWASFDGATFSGAADFEGAAFSGEAIFNRATFSVGASFNGATFSAGASFNAATFSGDADFEGAAFSDEALFNRATFSAGAGFYGAAFSGWADFGGATFSTEANFSGATFSRRANFGVAAFSGGATFARVAFSGWANFGNTTFGQKSTFVNAEMNEETSFEHAVFKTEPPHFFGAKLHQGTVWRGITWPPTPKYKNEAGHFIDAYACLKLEMDRLKKHEDELDFFALELQSRRVLLGRWRGWPIWLYGVLSDYGRSYVQPLLALLALVAGGAAVFRHFDAQRVGDAFGLSAANTLNVFGFRKDFFDAAAIECLPAPLKILAAVQTILGTILLFLFGLGVRNKFRMK